MGDLIPELSSLVASDPDAQATVTDFLDYTEFFQSDLFRSLTLIGQLDEVYLKNTSKVHSLTKTYGSLPKVAVAERPNPQKLRSDISASLEYALRSREATFAEAARIRDVASNLSTRLVNIRKKLQALPKPPSRDPTPIRTSVSPNVGRNRSNKLESSAPKITLHVDRTNNRIPKHQKHQLARRTIVPGEVLPPPEFISSSGIDFESSEESDSEERRYTSSPVRLSQPRQVDDKIHEKITKIPKNRKDIRIRPPGVMGTNVHSSVAGISVSNAMACLPPPPENPKPGSTHAPWLKLTEWELNALRKKMKKNADWQPSSMMIARCLKETGRGQENMRHAKELAEQAGEQFLDEEPPEFIRPPTKPVVQNLDDVGGENNEILENRGMKLNQAKKIKRENMQKAREAQEQSEMESAQKRISDAGLLVQNLLLKSNVSKNNTAELFSSQSEMLASSSRSSEDSKKRRRDSVSVEGSSMVIDNLDPIVRADTENGLGTAKKLRLITSTAHSLPPMPPESSAKTPATSNTFNSAFQSVEAVPHSRSTSVQRSRRTSTTLTTTELLPPSNASTGRPLSSRSNKASGISLKLLPSKKAASAEPSQPNGHRRSSLRRVSDGSIAPTDQQNKGPTSTRPGQNSSTSAGNRRTKRPTPGLLTSHGEDGGAKVSLGKRKAAPTRKVSIFGACSKRPDASSTGPEEFIDPNEPRYCICGDVSFGTMIACENERCEKEWFHLACVGLEEIPGRRAKWYCPDCRKKFKVGGDGTVDATRRVK